MRRRSLPWGRSLGVWLVGVGVLWVALTVLLEVLFGMLYGAGTAYAVARWLGEGPAQP